jgi:hypothetical protein
MAGTYAGSRSGNDGPARIAHTAEMLLEASEVPPVPRYQAVVPFLPSNITDASGTLAAAGTTTDSEFKLYPDRLDLFIWQGDDIQIPLYFMDPANPTLDMSTWTWKAQARTWYDYYGRLVWDTVETASAATANGVTTTLVNLFVPRQVNRFRGVFWWELQSSSPYTGPSMVGQPRPDDVPATDWPPTTQVKTWLYGKLYVVPRLSSTDTLPPKSTVTNGQTILMTPEGWVAGPNGRVP